MEGEDILEAFRLDCSAYPVQEDPEEGLEDICLEAHRLEMEHLDDIHHDLELDDLVHDPHSNDIDLHTPHDNLTPLHHLCPPHYSAGPHLARQCRALNCDPKKSSAATKQHPLFLVPEEVHMEIFSYLDPFDVWNIGKTCRFFARLSRSEVAWRWQWNKLMQDAPFSFPKTQILQELGVCFKDACRRLCVTLCRRGGTKFTKCVHCKERTCRTACVQHQRSAAKIVLDIGGKMTWLLTGDFSLRKHLSMIAVPKLLHCYDCDARIERGQQTTCDCRVGGYGGGSDWEYSYAAAGGGSYGYQPRSRGGFGAAAASSCRYRSVSSHTGLQYMSQGLTSPGGSGTFTGGDMHLVPPHPEDQPLCLFCEEDRLNKLLCEKDMVVRTRDTLAAYGHTQSYTHSSSPTAADDQMAAAAKQPNSSLSTVQPLTNGYCREALALFGADNIDLLSPLIALEHNEAFSIVKSYLDHIIKTFKLLEDLQRPNFSLVFTEPALVGSSVIDKLLKYLFEEIHVARLCLLPKALAVALLFEQDTCIVVDSGATMTSVSIVLNGRVEVERTQTVNIGGWHLSEFLKQAMSWKESRQQDSNGGCPPQATVSSLDTADVKGKCRLSLNLVREESRSNFHRPETFRVKSQSSLRRGGAASGGYNSSWGYGGAGAVGGGGSGGRTEYAEIQLSSELVLAPEMMYASLDLPGMIVRATQDLPHEFIKDCFSNILVTGGNTDLQGFNARLSSDLRDSLPEHANIINILAYPATAGNHSWNTAMGANMIQAPQPYRDILSLHCPGTPFWISREEYILFGNHQLAQSSGDVGE